MRLWAAAVDYTEDVRCSDEILQRVTDAYRKFRNTLRYALGNLDGFNPETDNVSYQEMLEIDRWALASFDEAAKKILDGYERYDFQAVYQTIYNLFTVTLSARYFDIIKDRLYIYAPRSVERRSAQTALYEITDKMCRLLAPVLAFTADEAFENLPHQKLASVHLAEFPKVSGADNLKLLNDWERIFAIRDDVLKKLEEARNAKEIGSSLEAKVVLKVDKETMNFLVAVLRKSALHLYRVAGGSSRRKRKFRHRNPKSARREMRTLLELFRPRRRIGKIPDRLRTMRRGFVGNRKIGGGLD